MVATVEVYVENGPNATPVESNTTLLSPVNIRFKTADDALIDANNPIPIPASGTKRSYWKHIFLKVTAGPFLQINNVQFFTNGIGFGTGIDTFVGDQLPTKTSVSTAGYDQAIGMVGDDGNEMTTHANVSTKSNTNTYDNSPTTLTITIGEAGAIIDAVGETTNYLVAQMDVDSTAGPGDLPNETWTFQYDEI